MAQLAKIMAGAGFAALIAVSGAQAGSFVYSKSPANGDVIEFKYKGFTTENTGVTLGSSAGFETTWGIGTVTDIFDLTKGGGPIWVGSAGNPQDVSLDFVLYGIADDSISSTSPFRLDNSGCTAGAGNGGVLS